MMEIKLDLSKYCIETSLKRVYKRLLSEYFRQKGGDAELEAKLSLLQEALNRFDFSALRTKHLELAGNSEARIILVDNKGNLPGISINGTVIDTRQHCFKE